jgi:hypothetical protein
MDGRSERRAHRRDKHERRLHRQIDALARAAPWGRRTLEKLREKRMRRVRVPVGILMILAGFLGFLPIFGFWMLPLGLLLLAVDLPLLRPAVTSASIRGRRRLSGWWRRMRAS